MSIEVDEACDVCVVGAGLAGLCAALGCADGGVRRIAIVEALPRAGGRTETRLFENIPYDVGGQWVSPRHTYLLNLAERFGVKTEKQAWPEGAGLFAPSGSDARLRWLERISSDAASVEDWMDGWSGLFLSEDDRRELTKLVRAFLACEPREVSPAYLCWSLRSCGGVDAIADGPGGAQDAYFTNGVGALTDAIVAHLKSKGASVLFDTPVDRIRRTEVTLKTGRVIRARHVVVACPPRTWWRLVDGIGAVPRALSTGMRAGRVIKTVSFFRETDLMQTKKLSACTGPLNDVLPCRGAFVGLIVADTARTLSPETIEGAVLGQLREYFDRSALEHAAFDSVDWSRQPTIGGCFAAFPKPGFLDALQKVGDCLPDASITFACTELAREHGSYMEGAVRSGRAAARRAVALLKK